VPADGLSKFDTRNHAGIPPLAVRIVQAMGGRAMGSLFDSYSPPRSALARLDRGGYAEVASGDLPDRSLTEALDASRADID
jgi:hypothetical protein